MVGSEHVGRERKKSSLLLARVLAGWRMAMTLNEIQTAREKRYATSELCQVPVGYANVLCAVGSWQ